MTEALILPVLGLVSDPGPFTSAPEGSLIEAQNVVLLRPGAVEPRPGAQFIVDPTLKSGGYTAQAMYSDPLDGLYVWALVGASTWIIRKNPTTITGPSSFTTGKVRCIPTGGRGLFTSNHGVCSLPGQAASPMSGSATIAYRAGMPQPYAPRMLTTAAPAGYPAGANWLATGDSVAYRVTLRRRLANGTIVESPPSQRVVVTNSAGASRAVQLTDVAGGAYYAWAPNGVGALGFNDLLTGDELCVYRSPKITGTPSDEMKLRAVLTWNTTYFGFVDVVNGTATPWLDALDDGTWTGQALYTNETQEGAGLANYRPEYARDIALYNGMTFYAGAQTSFRVDVTLRGLGQTGAPPTDASQKLLTFAFAGVTATGVNTITTIAATDIVKFSVGQVVTTAVQAPGAASATFPANTQVTAINTSTGVVTLSANAGTTGAVAGIAWDWIESSIAGSRIYYNDTGLVGTLPARYFTIGADELDNRWNGDNATSLQLRCSGVSQTENILCSWFRPDNTDATFSIRSSKPLAWDRYVDSVTGVAALKDGGIAELRWSKVNEPEHCPVPYRTTIGDAALPIRRISVAHNSLLIFKDDGVFQCFGSVPTPNDGLQFELLDRTILMPAPPAQAGDNADPHASWLIRYDDRVYIMSTRGPMSVTDGGGTLVGAPILETLRNNLGDLYGAGGNVVAAMAPDFSARRVVYFANGTGYVHDVDTGLWTTWVFRSSNWPSAATSRPAPSFGAISLGISKVPWGFAFGYAIGIMQPRTVFPSSGSSTGSASDVAPLSDAWFGLTATVNTVTGTGPYTVTIAAGSEWTPTVGDIILDGGGSYCVVTAITSATVFTTDRSPGTGTRSWYEGFPSRVIWVGNAMGNAGVEKHVQRARYPLDLTLLFSRYVSPTERVGPVKSYFRGYRNADPAVEAFMNVDTGIGASPYPIAPAFLVADTPMSLAEDWAIRVGFTVEQAGVWFSTSGLILDYELGGDVER